MRFVLLFVASLCFGAISAQAEPAKEDSSPTSPRELLSRALSNRFRLDSTLSMSISILPKGGVGETKIMNIRSVWQGNKLCTYAEFVEPAESRGRKFLSIKGDDGFSYQKIYLPAFKRVRGISLAQKKDSFEGSDLNYEDVETRRVEDYEVLSAEPDQTQGEKALRIVAKPLYESVYEKAEYVVASDGVILALFLYERGALIKSIIAPRNAVVEMGGHRLPTKLVVKNELMGGETVVTTVNLVVNPPLSTDEICSETQLTVSR